MNKNSKSTATQTSKKPTPEDFEHWLSDLSEIPVSRDFSANTLKRIEANSSVPRKWAQVIVFKNIFLPLAAAFLVALTLNIFWKSNPETATSTPSANSATQASVPASTPSSTIYTDPEYLAFEELLLMQENLETFASLDLTDF